MLAGCPIGPELQELHRGQQCHCSKSHPGTADVSFNGSVAVRSKIQATDRHMYGWGLPSGSCPATPYLLDEYPARHRQWLSEGRVLVHCSTSGGFGDYLRSIPSVVVLSMFLELALVLQCDIPTYDPLNRLREQRLHLHMPRMFVGPHFDWTRRVRLLKTASEEKSSDSRTPSGLASDPRSPLVVANETDTQQVQNIIGEYSIIHDLTGQQMRSYSRASSSTRVFSNAFAHARRLIKFNMNWSLHRLGAYASRANYVDIDGCLLRYLLAPSKHLVSGNNAIRGGASARNGECWAICEEKGSAMNGRYRSDILKDWGWHRTGDTRRLGICNEVGVLRRHARCRGGSAMRGGSRVTRKGFGSGAC